MKAIFPGISPLTMLIGCTCGYRSNYLDRARFEHYNGGICDNCHAWIEYTFRVRPFEVGGKRMALEADYKQTPERKAITLALNEAKEALERTAKLLNRSGSRERAQEVVTVNTAGGSRLDDALNSTYVEIYVYP